MDSPQKTQLTVRGTKVKKKRELLAARMTTGGGEDSSRV